LTAAQINGQCFFEPAFPDLEKATAAQDHTMTDKHAYMVAAGLFLAGLSFGRVYEIASDNNDRGDVWRVNKITGTVARCDGYGGVRCTSAESWLNLIF